MNLEHKIIDVICGHHQVVVVPAILQKCEWVGRHLAEAFASILTGRETVVQHPRPAETISFC